VKKTTSSLPQAEHGGRILRASQLTNQALIFYTSMWKSAFETRFVSTKQHPDHFPPQKINLTIDLSHQENQYEKASGSG